MKVQIDTSWDNLLREESKQEYFQALLTQVEQLYKERVIFPDNKLIFNAFNLCPFDKIKVIILGQDPYHGPGQAHGLAFSVPDLAPHPPSLKNIYKELQADIGGEINLSGNLERWAKQGVLLLNTSLTVEENLAGSHQGFGWEKFSDAVIKKISHDKEHMVFLLWGNSAIKKRVLIDENKHLVLTAPHPSPLSAYRGFFGSKPFGQTNKYLKQTNQREINW